MKSKLFDGFSLSVLMGVVAGLTSSGVAMMPQKANADETSVGIEEVVVTARRREETAQSVPIPISALSSDYLEERGITEIQNIEQVTPNLAFVDSISNSGAAQVFLRGIGQVNWGPTQDPKVGTYLDGVYLGRPQGSVFDLFDIERVEVLRGPQGTLFGRNTTAGLVHVITKDPTDEFEGKVRFGAGNQGQVTTDALLNMPLIEGVLSGRFSMQTRRDDGWMKDRSGRKWNETDSKSARAKLLWTPTDTLEAMLTAEYFGARETASLGKCIGYSPTSGLNGLAAIAGRLDNLAAACTPVDDYYLSNDNDPNASEADVRHLSLDVSWDMDWGTLTSITATRSMEMLSESWGWGTDFVGGPSNSLEVLKDYNKPREPYEQVSQEFRIDSDAMDGKLAYTVGAYWFWESATQTLSVPAYRGVDASTVEEDAVLFAVPMGPDAEIYPGATFGDLFAISKAAIGRDQETHATQSSYAAFAEATYDIDDDWSVTAGYRYTKDTREFRRYNFLVGGGFDAGNLCPGMPVDANGAATREYCDQKLSYGRATPRVIANYKMSDDIMVYASFARGYSSGGMNGDIRMKRFEPEVSDNWEIGMKSQMLDNTLQLNWNIFQTDYENQQITVSRLVQGQPTADIINAQKASLSGVELDFQWTPIANLYITGSYGYLHGLYDEFTVEDVVGYDPLTQETQTALTDYSHIEFVRGSPSNWSVHAAYEIPMDSGANLTSMVGWSYRGRTFSTLQTHDTSRQDSYGLLDARFVWNLANGRTSVTIWGTNLTDEEYFRGALDLPSETLIDGSTTDRYGDPILPDLGSTTIYPSEPRRFGLTLTHNLTN